MTPDWADLDHVLTYVWTLPAAGSNVRRSQLDYGKTRAHEIVTAMLNEREAQARAEVVQDLSDWLDTAGPPVMDPAAVSALRAALAAHHRPRD